GSSRAPPRVTRAPHSRGWFGTTRESSQTARKVSLLEATSGWRRSYGAAPIGSGAMGNSPGGNANVDGIVASATSSIRHRFIWSPGPWGVATAVLYTTITCGSFALWMLG